MPSPEDLIAPISNNYGDYSNSKAHHPYSSTSPPAYSTTRTVSFASVSLHQYDRIRFVQFPDHDLPRILDIITTSWSNGIQNTRQYAESFEIKLKGNPWVHASPGAIPGDKQARRLIRQLLEGLYNLGWLFDTGVRLCRKPNEKDTMIFMKYENRPTPPPREWLLIASDNFNLLTIQCGPTELIETLRTRFGEWINTTSIDDSCTQFTLKGMPWGPSGKSTVKTRSMLLIIRETLDICGFGIYANLTMQSGNSETDLLVCSRERRFGEEGQGGYEKGR